LSRPALVILLLATSPAPAQQRPPSDPLLQWMNRIAQEQLDLRDKYIAAIRTTQEAERRKSAVRDKLLKLMGGLPDYKGPLNPKVTGRLHNESFTIEKVIYESLPGFFVTANVYLPNRPGRYPAILMQNGHTQEGKAEPQKLAANLALKGFVVLSFDPIGQEPSRIRGRFDAPWSISRAVFAARLSRVLDLCAASPSGINSFSASRLGSRRCCQKPDTASLLQIPGPQSALQAAVISAIGVHS
jgi:hypothetical protein